VQEEFIAAHCYSQIILQFAPLAQSPMMQQPPDPSQPGGGAPTFFPMFRR
jgi:hypothetical protein